MFSFLLQEFSSGSSISSRVYAEYSLFIDEFSVIRVGGRLQNAMCSWDRKHPILLPKDSHLSKLIIHHWHLSACHARSKLLISLVNGRFWIMGVRRIVYKTIKSCITCVKLNGVNSQPKISYLPVSRVQICQAFTAVGIDFGGPLVMKKTKFRKVLEYKFYIALFVCMSTKAIHLDIVLDLSTDAFLTALDRFVARLG